MGRWYEDDLLISADLDNVYYCNGDYEGYINMRVAVDMECDAQECRFHFFCGCGHCIGGGDYLQLRGLCD